MSIARRSIESITWNAVASVVQVMVGIVRSVLLARMLPVEVFGIYGLAGSIVRLTAVVPSFDLSKAFLHRSTETENEDHAASVWLSLKLIFASIWLALISIGGLQFASGAVRVALLVIAVSHWGVNLTMVPRQILVRRVRHGRLALLQVIDLILSGILAILLAWRGAGIWALLSTDLISLAVRVYFLYLWRPVWRPHLAWSRSTAQYFVRFGSQSVLGSLLLEALDRVDDLWTGAYLGRGALGFYSRAYAFATYPRTVLASSVNAVAGGTYAELAGRRRQLSQAFFRTNAFLVRTGFFVGGLLVLVAPEFIHLLLGRKWLPMLTAFRLMLVFTLLDPIKITVANLFVAVGRPGIVAGARGAQLAVMVAGLFLLGPALGIAGVALAVDAMLLLGIGLLFRQARSHVDFSLKTLFAAPALGLVAGMALGRAAIVLPGILGSPWRTGSVKALVFVLVYTATLLIVERRQLLKIASFFADSLFGDAQVCKEG
jgi:O-antigen/teichoic acid export membrane protein